MPSEAIMAWNSTSIRGYLDEAFERLLRFYLVAGV